MFALGSVAGWLGFRLYGRSDLAVMALGAGGGLVLLWATLAVQGWSIQSVEGFSPPEQINQWVHRGLSLTGTFLAVVSARSAYFAR